jgi:hypothetical protein
MRHIGTLASDSTTQTQYKDPESETHGPHDLRKVYMPTHMSDPQARFSNLQSPTTSPRRTQSIDARHAILNDAGGDQYNEFNFTRRPLAFDKIVC